MAIREFAKNLFQNTHLNLRIDYISVSVAGNLNCHIVAFVLHVFAF